MQSKTTRRSKGLGRHRARIVSELLAGRSLAEIGADLGTSKQAVHYQVGRAAAEVGCGGAEFHAAIEEVQRGERLQRAERVRSNEYVDGADGRRPAGLGRAVKLSERYAAELMGLADGFLAGQWTAADQERAEWLDGYIRAGGV